MALAIRSGKLRSAEVVEGCIRALQASSEINAVAVERFSAARLEAAAADALVGASNGQDLPPFLGVPILLKEAFEYPGLQYTNGLASRRGRLGQEKGPVVQRVEEAGFIVIATGNISEACMWMESYNKVYGRTSSPYDLSRTCGGSSGGTAASVAVLGAPVGITADIGGSTRIPALFCGLYGHKPTGGLVANTRSHLDNFHGSICRICQPGAVTRHAEDLMHLVQLLAGPPSPEMDPNAAEYLPLQHWVGSTVSFRRLTVIPLSFKGGLPRSFVELLLSSVDGSSQRAQATVVQWFAAQGSQVRPMHFEELCVGSWFGTWADLNQSAGGPTFRQVICRGKQTFGAGELLRYALGTSEHTAPALALAFMEGALEWFASSRRRSLAKAEALRADLEAALGDYGVFVMPILPRRACRHDELLLRAFDCSFTCIWNAMGFPATAVPLGLEESLPVGVQIVSSRGNDALTLSLALALEEAGLAQCVPPPSSGL